MQKALSLIACLIVCAVLLSYRVSYSPIGGDKPIKITTSDALGYYMYLPGMFIYKDVTQLKWVQPIDSQYSVTGGSMYQAGKAVNDNYVFKYLGGVALMQIPLFFIAHYGAKQSGYPANGFSQPYQDTLALGILIYCMLAIFLLRKVLLRYFSDRTTAITILVVCLATNLIQYVAIDSAQSHAYIFVLYVLVLYTTIRWHEKPSILWAALTGYIIGLATISRPTETIMLFIPLLWNTHTKHLAKEKWQQVQDSKSHVIIAITTGFIGILPQLLYWKYVTGSFIYDVGSKWDFLNPHFRVLFGWEKGWFIYTPITLFFIAGMFFMKTYPFKKSVLWFCLLNIYIIIGWHDWRYGGSYSTRALVQSYPVFALPFAAITEKIGTQKWRWVFYAACVYLLGVNLFQIKQYNSTILHYNDMNRQYYGRIYLNPHPSAIDMSLLDTREILRSETGYDKSVLFDDSAPDITHNGNTTLFETNIDGNRKGYWLKIENEMKGAGYWGSTLNALLSKSDSTKETSIRLYNGRTREYGRSDFAFYMYVPPYFAQSHLNVYIYSSGSLQGEMYQLKITKLER